jgi:hypothetical protein
MKKIGLILTMLIMMFASSTVAFAEVNEEKYDTNKLPIKFVPKDTVSTFGPGEWDLIDTQSDFRLISGQTVTTKTVYSYGGDFKVNVSNAYSNNYYVVAVYEQDPDSPDDFLGEVPAVGNGDIIIENLNSAVDGEKAELYFRFKYVSYDDIVDLKYYD